jgi:hypothetical protein
MPQHLVEGNLLVKISALKRDQTNIEGYQLATEAVRASVEAGLTTFFTNRYIAIDPQVNVTIIATVL